MPPSAEKIDVHVLLKKAKTLKHATPPPEDQFRTGVRIGRLIEAKRQQESAERKRGRVAGWAAVASVILGAIFADDVIKQSSIIVDYVPQLIHYTLQRPQPNTPTPPATSTKAPPHKPTSTPPKPGTPLKQGVMVAKEHVWHCSIEIQGKQAKTGSKNPELLKRLAVAYQQFMAVDVIDERLYQAKSAIEDASPEMCNTLCTAQSAYPRKNGLHNKLICQDIDSVTKSVSPSPQ